VTAHRWGQCQTPPPAGASIIRAGNERPLARAELRCDRLPPSTDFRGSTLRVVPLVGVRPIASRSG
jgi:hypothetical protein